MKAKIFGFVITWLLASWAGSAIALPVSSIRADSGTVVMLGIGAAVVLALWQLRRLGAW